MFKFLRGCLGTLVAVVGLLGVAFLGWRYGGALFPGLLDVLGLEERGAPGEVEPSYAIADRALSRYELLLASDSGAVAGFSGVEVTSMLRYSFPGTLPEGLRDPTVRVSGGTLRLEARIAVDQFPRFPRLEGVFEILPDTIPLEVRASVLPFDQRNVSVLVESVDASAIPVPRRFIPQILEAVGRRPIRGLPPSAVAVPLPDGLAGVFLEGDSLFVVSGG